MWVSQSINTSYAVIVLGDRDTVARPDLQEKATEQGAVITETYSFDPGETASHDNLTCVEAAVTALSRAIETRTDIWMPFPMVDFGREQHIRRLSMVLQRHGLNMLIGRDLEPCTTDGGFNEIDYALRAEVRAVDELDNAALSAAGVRTLFAEIERELAAAEYTVPAPPRPAGRTPVRAGAGEKRYSIGEVARLFGQSVQWIDWALRSGIFVRTDGTAIEPERVGKSRRRRFSLPVLREMAQACYRRRIVSEDELLNLLAVLECTEGE